MAEPPAGLETVGTLHLSARHRARIEALLAQAPCPAWRSGHTEAGWSGRSHDGSDLDLVLRGPGLGKIDALRLADAQDALRESTIPFLVELHDWARLPKGFHPEIERLHVVLVR